MKFFYLIDKKLASIKYSAKGLLLSFGVGTIWDFGVDILSVYMHVSCDDERSCAFRACEYITSCFVLVGWRGRTVPLWVLTPLFSLSLSLSLSLPLSLLGF